ncbi:hypothetical protein ACFVY4_20240 [Streptomyces sp. NPDC058299]|uniref:hypothetical protein n=1 Tax=Streptomyces sp. NPDC058299 TaxID=3346435 RepID=UPI0036E50BAA
MDGAKTVQLSPFSQVGGLIKRAGRRENFRTDLVLQQRRGSQRKADESDADGFRLAPDVSLAAYAEAAERTDSVFAGVTTASEPSWIARRHDSLD